MFEKVKSGEAVACFEDTPVLKYMISSGELDFKTPCDKENPSNYGFAVLKGENAELLKMFNAGLENLKSNGEYDKILAKYE
jgi:polar amino acid transport system substrate-binding protein